MLQTKWPFKCGREGDKGGGGKEGERGEEGEIGRGRSREREGGKAWFCTII
jgi:hypothetical protein